MDDLYDLGIVTLRGVELFTALKKLTCWGNPIAALDVGKNAKLEELSCYDCQLEALDLSPYLDERIEELDVGGESGPGARPCAFDWVLDVRAQCAEYGAAFSYHQTGALLIKDGREYRIPRKYQRRQARKALLELAETDPAAETAEDGLPDKKTEKNT